jgi:hypothetical protein
VPDHDAFGAAVTRHQVEGEATGLLPMRLDGQVKMHELVDQPPQRGRGRHQLLDGDRVVGVGFTPDQ